MNDVERSPTSRSTHRARAFTVLVAACALLAVSAAFALHRAQTLRRGSVKTDLRVYAEPPPPPLPAAGGKFFDPVFGTEIMRVTDARSTGNHSAGTSYSYWPTFNCDNTRLLAMRDGAPSGLIYNFDPVNFQLGDFYELPPLPNSNNAVVRGDDAVWSARDPDILYAHTDMRLYAFNTRTRAFRLVADLARRLAPRESVFQMSKSESDDIFAFTRRGAPPAYASLGYVAYQASTDTILRQGTGSIDECQIDKTGRYVVWKTGEQGVGKIEVKIVDLQTGATTNLTDDAPDHAPGHSDNGHGTVVGAGNYLVGISARSLATPHAFTKLFDLTPEQEYGAYHVSMLADNEGWALIDFEGRMANGVMQGEIVQVATDGSGRVRRLLHHHAAIREYYDQPRANISRDGRFVAFTSNWGVAGGRRDLFVARIDPAPLLPQVRPRRAAQ